METLKKIISIDAETNGLWGNPFAIAAVIYENGEEKESICLRLPDSVVTNDWVKENVLPTLDFPVTHKSYQGMLKEFSKFYMKHKDAIAIWHMGHVVEAFLFREMHRLGFIGDFDAPYCPIEVSSLMRAVDYLKPDSVDSFMKDRGLTFQGETHNPLFDCRVAAKTLFATTKMINKEYENICPPDKIGGTRDGVDDFTLPGHMNYPMHQQF